MRASKRTYVGAHQGRCWETIGRDGGQLAGTDGRWPLRHLTPIPHRSVGGQIEPCSNPMLQGTWEERGARVGRRRHDDRYGAIGVLKHTLRDRRFGRPPADMLVMRLMGEGRGAVRPRLCVGLDGFIDRTGPHSSCKPPAAAGGQS